MKIGIWWGGFLFCQKTTTSINWRHTKKFQKKNMKCLPRSFQRLISQKSYFMNTEILQRAQKSSRALQESVRFSSIVIFFNKKPLGRWTPKWFLNAAFLFMLYFL